MKNLTVNAVTDVPHQAPQHFVQVASEMLAPKIKLSRITKFVNKEAHFTNKTTSKFFWRHEFNKYYENQAAWHAHTENSNKNGSLAIPCLLFEMTPGQSG